MSQVPQAKPNPQAQPQAAKPDEKITAPGRTPKVVKTGKETRKLKKFRLLAGTHTKAGEPFVEEDQQGNRKTVKTSVRFRAGDIVADYANLAKRWPEKFQRVADDLPEGTPAPENTTDDDLEDLNVRQLRGIAANIEADLTDATTKDDVIAAIRLRREQMTEDGED